MIVDAGVHIWADDSPARPWPTLPDGSKRKAPRAEAFGGEELVRQMDVAGVAAALLIPPTWDGERNDVALAAAHAHPRRLGVMGRLVLHDPDAEERVEEWCGDAGMIGMRLVFWPDEGWPRDGSHGWLWSALERHDIPVMLATLGDCSYIEGLVARHPGLRVTIDHLGCAARARDEIAFADLPNLLKLARYPNVSVKASCMPFYSSDPYPFRNVHHYIESAFDAFGPHRMFWGTDLTRLPCSYRQAVTMFTEELPFLSGEDLTLVMGEALCDWLGWRGAGDGH